MENEFIVVKSSTKSDERLTFKYMLVHTSQRSKKSQNQQNSVKFELYLSNTIDLIDLVDQALLSQFYDNHTKYDSARIKSLSGNGAMTWTDVAQDEHYGCIFTNQQSVLETNNRYSNAR